MATQIKVNSATGNVTIQLSRTVIGTVVTANTANYANFAGTAETANNLNATTTANVVIGGGINGYVLQTNGAGTTSWVAQAGGGGTQPGGANTEVQYNDAGTMAGDPAFTFNDVTSTLTTGTISATNIGNITPTNLDGNTANYLDGTGTFAPVVAASATTAEQVIRLCKAVQIVTKGQAVTITGGTGDNPDVNLADASSTVLMPAIGIALEDIALNALGNIALYGEVAGIDTTAFSVGDSVYISATIPGALTDTSPKGETNLVQKVGKVVRDNANGIVMVQGAGRSNETPNLDAGNIFLGDAFNQSSSAVLNTSIVPENTNLYYTDGRSRAALSTTTTAAASGGALAYDNGTGVFTFTPADVAAGTYGDSNVVTLMGAFGSNTITTTGLITGDGGGLSNIVGANVTGEVAFAATANAVALANVAGAGNIASINLDGNVSNVLSGDGSFIAAGGAGGIQAQIANGTSNVDIATLNGNVTVGVGGTANIAQFTPTGANIKTSLLVDGVNGNVLIQPNVALDGKTYSSIVRGEYNTGTGNSTTDQAIVTDNYTTQGITNIQTFANTAAGQIAKGPAINFNNYAAIGNTNTDPLVAGQVAFYANPDGANLANVDTQTGTTMTMGGAATDGFLIVQGTNAGDSYGGEVWKQFQYRPKAMGFIRRNGNADSRSASVANDETSLAFYNTQEQGGAGSSNLWNYPAKMGAKVDPTWVDPQNGSLGIPQGFSFTVVDTGFANLEHRMYANGDTIFNTAGGGTPITLGYNGVITGDGGGLSNISVAAGTSIVNGTSNVSVALDGNVTAGVGGVADVLTLTTTGANVKTSLFVDNTDGNVLLDPNVAFNSDTFTNITRGKWDGTKSTLNTALVTEDYAGTGQFSQIMYANTTAGQIAQGPKITLEDKSTIGNTNTDPFVHSSVSFSAAAPTSNLAAASTATHSTVTLDGSLTIDTGSNLQTGGSEYQTATIQQYQYQNRGVEFYRRGGNADSTAGVAANDEVAIVSHMASAAGGVAFNSYSGKIAFKVDSAWVDPGDFSQGVPQGIEFEVTDTNYARLFHNMYANGTVAFNSAGPGTTVTIGSNGVITGDGGGLSNVSATATPGGFFDSVQFNNSGALGGDSVFTYNSSSKQLGLSGAAAGAGGVPTFNLNNGGFNVNQEEIGGGAATFAFNNYYAGSLIAPSTYFRARGTRNAPTQVGSGDQILNEGYYVNSGTGHTYVGVGGQSTTVKSNDGLGNVTVQYTIATAKPANGPNSLDQIFLDSEFVNVAGNIQMNNTSASFTAGRIKQIADTFSNLTASPVIGERAIITDGPAFNTFGTAVGSGGGSQVMPLFWDGSDWRMG